MSPDQIHNALISLSGWKREKLKAIPEAECDEVDLAMGFDQEIEAWRDHSGHYYRFGPPNFTTDQNAFDWLLQYLGLYDPAKKELHVKYRRSLRQSLRKHAQAVLEPPTMLPPFPVRIEALLRTFGKWLPEAYSEPVKFSNTDQYGTGPEDEDDVYTVEEFVAQVKGGAFNDYDGSGAPVKDGLRSIDFDIYPSLVHEIPEDATHVVWFNK